jgi:hypothetical protein
VQSVLCILLTTVNFNDDVYAAGMQHIKSLIPKPSIPTWTTQAQRDARNATVAQFSDGVIKPVRDAGKVELGALEKTISSTSSDV